MSTVSNLTRMTDADGPPSDVQLEQAVLGAILMEPTVFSTVSFLKPEHFYEELHQKIYEAAYELHRAGKVVTLLMVRPHVPNQQVGPLTMNQYLAKLASEGAPTIKYAPDYAREIIAFYQRRAGFFWGKELQRLAQEGGDLQAALAEARDELKATYKPNAISWLEMSHWDSEPSPEREWAILNRVPLKQAGLFSGEGGTGKSILELHKDVAHVAGKDWLGSLPEPGPAFYIGAEDDEREIHIRLAAIAKHCRVTFAELTQKGLRVLPLLGQDATLCHAAGKSGKVEVTGLYKQLYEAAGDLKPKNISIDTLSRAFAGSEIDRVQVYAFAQHMQALAMVAQGSVTILSHPSLNGINSGSGISGSTAWHGAFRFRQYLTSSKPEAGEQPDNDLRQLEFKKNQYGPTEETIVLKYQNGLFLPVPGQGSLEKVAAESKADDVFLELLCRFEVEKRNVSDKVSPTYAPTTFAQEQEAKSAKLGPKQLEAAMRRLFAAGKIENQVTGPASRQRSRLALK